MAERIIICFAASAVFRSSFKTVKSISLKRVGVVTVLHRRFVASGMKRLILAQHIDICELVKVITEWSYLGNTKTTLH